MDAMCRVSLEVRSLQFLKTNFGSRCMRPKIS